MLCTKRYLMYFVFSMVAFLVFSCASPTASSSGDSGSVANTTSSGGSTGSPSGGTSTDTSSANFTGSEADKAKLSTIFDAATVSNINAMYARLPEAEQYLSTSKNIYTEINSILYEEIYYKNLIASAPSSTGSIMFKICLYENYKSSKQIKTAYTQCLDQYNNWTIFDSYQNQYTNFINYYINKVNDALNTVITNKSELVGFSTKGKIVNYDQVAQTQMVTFSFPEKKVTLEDYLTNWYYDNCILSQYIIDTYLVPMNIVSVPSSESSYY